MEHNHLEKQIQDLLHASIRAYDIKENDAVSLKTLKLILIGRVLEGVGLDWTYLINLLKTHSPVHPTMARELGNVGDEELTGTLAQIFVRNEKLLRLLKPHGKEKEESEVKYSRLLAVDGLGGNLEKGPNFEQKHYLGNLRYGNAGDVKMPFDSDPEFKRLHVQTVRELYKKLENVPVPEKQVYTIVKYSFDELARVVLPKIEFMEGEIMDKNLQDECGRFYMRAMGKENIESMAKSLKLVTKGEKRHHVVERTCSEDEPASKR